MVLLSSVRLTLFRPRRSSVQCPPAPVSGIHLCSVQPSPSSPASACHSTRLSSPAPVFACLASPDLVPSPLCIRSVSDVPYLWRTLVSERSTVLLFLTAYFQRCCFEALPTRPAAVTVSCLESRPQEAKISNRTGDPMSDLRGNPE